MNRIAIDYIEHEEVYMVISGKFGIPLYDRTLQGALIKSIQQAGIEGVELAPTLEAAEVLESLLGASK